MTSMPPHDLQVVELLRESLAREAQRVIDLFKEWDDNSDGVISRQEFHTAMALLGVAGQPELIDRLFDIFDPDKSGEIEYKEFANRLKRNTGAADGGADGAASAVNIFYKTKMPIAARKVATLHPQTTSMVDLIKAQGRRHTQAVWHAKIDGDGDATTALRDFLKSQVGLKLQPLTLVHTPVHTRPLPLTPRPIPLTPAHSRSHPAQSRSHPPTPCTPVTARGSCRSRHASSTSSARGIAMAPARSSCASFATRCSSAG